MAHIIPPQTRQASASKPFAARAMVAALFFFLCLLLQTQPTDAFDQSEKHVLLIANNPDYPAYEAFVSGVKGYLRQHSQYKFKLSYEYIDLSHFDSPEYLKETARYFKKKYTSWQPDCIISTRELDSFLAGYGQEAFTGTPFIVPCHEDSLPAEEDRSRYIWMPVSVNYGQSIELILHTKPQTKRIYIIAGDSAIERQVLDRARKATGDYPQVEWIFLTNLRHEELLQRVREISGDAAIFFLRWMKDVDGKDFVPVQVLKQVCQEAKVPVFGHEAQYLGTGIVGGYVYSHAFTGQKIAEVALDIVNGKIPAEISRTTRQTSEYAFDWRQLERWKIDPIRLPLGSRIEFRPHSFWDLYKWQILSVSALVIFETALIAGLLINLVRR